MKTVSRDEIIEVWERLCDMDKKQTDAVVKKFMKEQPALGIYLFANTESLGEDAQDRPVIDLVIACWQALSQAAGRSLKSVEPEVIERAEEINTQNLEKLEEASEIEWQNTVRVNFREYAQRELLGFGVEVLMSGNEENPELAPESIGMELLWLKTVIDCLEAS
jgi:hypothetical protein